MKIAEDHHQKKRIVKNGINSSVISSTTALLVTIGNDIERCLFFYFLNLFSFSVLLWFYLLVSESLR